MKILILVFSCFFLMVLSHSGLAVEKAVQDSQAQNTQNNKEQESTTNENEVEKLFETAEQSSVINPASQDIEQDVETLKVTGSRIRRIEFEGPNPVTIWTKEDLDNSGYLSVSEFLKNTSLSNFGDVEIHSRSTLTLINGTRLVHDGGLDLIPTSAIERIEILKDGAAALYGSDVVGGVINIITKKDFSSPEFSLKLAPTLYPFYKGGSKVDASAVFGKKFNKGHFISTFQFQYMDGIKGSDRKKWYNDYFLNYSPHPSFQMGGGQIAVDPKCPEDLKVKIKEVPIACKHNFVPYHYISPNEYYLSSYNYAEYKWINEISLYTQWFGFFGNSLEPGWPIRDNLDLPAGHKMSVGTGSAGRLIHLFDNVYKDESNNEIFLDGLVGAKGYISKTWDFDFSLKWSNIWTNNIHKNHPYRQDLVKAIVSGSYDPFNPEIRDLSKVRFYDAVYKDNDTRFFTSLDFSGETGFWDIDLALGLQAYYNKYRENADSEVKKGEIYGLAPAETQDLPSRTLVAAYAEGVKNFSDMLEVQLAGRIDHYSDFVQTADPKSEKKLEINSKWTANPKLAVYFKPFSQFLARASVGTSFEMPALYTLYTPTTTGFIQIHDTVACYNELKEKGHFEPIYNTLTEDQATKDKLIKEFLIEQSHVFENKKLSEAKKTAFKELANQLGDQNYCRRQSFKGTAKGNKNLKETKALTASLGFHWDLNEDHSLKVDGWFNSLSGTPVSSLHKNKKTIDAELRHGKEYVEKQGVQYERDSSLPYNPIKQDTPVTSRINMGGKKLYGVDMEWESQFSNWTVAGGNFYFKDEFAYVIKAGVEHFPGMGFINYLGTFTLPKWRNFSTFGWKNQKHNISFLLKSVASVKKYFNESETLPMGHTVDLFYQYNMNPKTSLKFGWYNVLFLEPVIDDSLKQGLKFNNNFYSLNGPYFFAELRRSL